MTTGNAAISLSTCIVGLLLLAPRTSVLASVRYAVLMMRRTPVVEMDDERPQIELTDLQSQPERERELVDA